MFMPEKCYVSNALIFNVNWLNIGFKINLEKFSLDRKPSFKSMLDQNLLRVIAKISTHVIDS